MGVLRKRAGGSTANLGPCLARSQGCAGRRVPPPGPLTARRPHRMCLRRVLGKSSKHSPFPPAVPPALAPAVCSLSGSWEASVPDHSASVFSKVLIVAHSWPSASCGRWVLFFCLLSRAGVQYLAVPERRHREKFPAGAHPGLLRWRATHPETANHESGLACCVWSVPPPERGLQLPCVPSRRRPRAGAREAPLLCADGLPGPSLPHCLAGHQSCPLHVPLPGRQSLDSGSFLLAWRDVSVSEQ